MAHALLDPFFAKQGSLRLLQNAKLLTARGQPYLGTARLQARAVTLNNLGCLMKKWGKPRVAISYLAQALRIEAAVPGGADNPAGTHLNMSAALSSVGMHREAAAHACHAIDLAARAVGQTRENSITTNTKQGEMENAVQEAGPETVGESDTADIDSTLGNRGGAEDENETERDEDNLKQYLECGTASLQGAVLPGETEFGGSDLGRIQEQQDRAAAGGLLTIAYFNLAVEHEHLGHVDAALDAYQNARIAADQHLGHDNPVAKGIELALESASKSFAIAAETDRTRTTITTRQGLASLPCIGKLRIRAAQTGANGEAAHTGELPSSPRRHTTTPRSYPREKQEAIERAYTSPRPNPPSITSGRALRSAPSPRVTGSNHRVTGARGVRHGHGRSEGKEDILWRARACADYGCSPREALEAQQQASAREEVLQPSLWTEKYGIGGCVWDNDRGLGPGRSWDTTGNSEESGG